MFGDVDVVMLP